MSNSPIIEWCGAFQNAELNALHAEGFSHAVLNDDWWGQVNRHSLGWVCAYESETLIGFANVAWDGGVHAFLLDVLVALPFRRQGLATAMIEEVVRQTKTTNCEWLHVDFEPHLKDFYLTHCGFQPTDAGVIALR